ncbi:MAG: hypothetical protein ACHQC8_01750 [Solirubrobacterales bacterium]
MDKVGAQPGGRGGSLNLPSVLAVLWIFRRAEKDEDPDRPEIVSTNAKSGAVLDRAEQLAGEGREDERAVADLRATARNRRRTLRRAERASRFMGYHRELHRANLTNRLLKAAVAREALPSNPTAGDRERIEAVENFNRLDRDQQWAQLTQLRPALLAVETDVRSGRFRDITTRDDAFLKDRTTIQETADGERRQVVTFSSSDPPLTEEETQKLRQQGDGLDELMTQLEPLVGPSCGDESPLLGSQHALDIANAYLLRSPH